MEIILLMQVCYYLSLVEALLRMRCTGRTYTALRQRVEGLRKCIAGADGGESE